VEERCENIEIKMCFVNVMAKFKTSVTLTGLKRRNEMELMQEHVGMGRTTDAMYWGRSLPGDLNSLHHDPCA
jgi:hypothetical protein